MKPFRIFIFFLSVLLLLLLMALLFPEQGIGVGGDFRLSFMTLADLTGEDTTATSVDIEQLLAGSMVTNDPEADPETDLFPEIGSRVDTIRPRVIPANVDSLKQHVHRILFAKEGASLLHPFFGNLERIASGHKRHTRILHFGDSQIENDRMTSLIRYRMQKHFGGTGTGLCRPYRSIRAASPTSRRSRANGCDTPFLERGTVPLRTNHTGSWEPLRRSPHQ